MNDVCSATRISLNVSNRVKLLDSPSILRIDAKCFPLHFREFSVSDHLTISDPKLGPEGLRFCERELQMSPEGLRDNMVN